MSKQDTTYFDDDDLEDNLEVASHTHQSRDGLQRGSAFSRGDQGWASFDPVTSSSQPVSNQPQNIGQDQLRPTPLVQSQPYVQPMSTQRTPQQTSRPASRQVSQGNSIPHTQRRSSASRQGIPSAQSSPRRQARGADIAAAQANRAAFDARYAESDAHERARYSAKKRRDNNFFAKWRARRQARRTRGTRHPVLRFFVGIIAVLALIYLVVCVPIDFRIAFDEPEASQVTSAKASHMVFEPYYVLLLGSDAREGEEISRTDTMILARVDIIRNQITLISIPRDTMVEIAGQGTQKINAAYTFGGTAGAMNAVSNLLGVPIAEAAIVHFDGISSMVDAVGGITVDVPVDVYDPDYTGLVMSAGTYEMDGETALLFSRVRHGFALGDYQRQFDQQLVIKALVNKLRSLAPWELANIGLSMGSLFDTSLRCYDMLPLLLRMVVMSPTVYQTSLPSYTETIDGVSYVIVNPDETADLMNVIDAGGDPADADVPLGLEE